MSKVVTKQAGFTLVEISLAMAIFTFMLLVVSMAYINIARLYNAGTAARNAQQNNRFAMEQISRVGRTSIAATATPTSICFTNSATVFYLKSVDANSPYKNELHQARSQKGCSDQSQLVSDTTLTSAGNYAAKITSDRSSSGTITVSLWMVSRTDLLKTVDDTLQCKQTSGSEFCAVNKLTTTVELRGSN